MKQLGKGKVDVIIGLQWGDEGKGKQIDEMLRRYDAICRFQGADNAGHSYNYNGISIVGHLMPSGALHESVDMIIGNGVLVNPPSLMLEKFDLESKGIDVSNRLYISERAKLVTYLHPFLDSAEEYRMGKGSVGSTVRGVGPAYKDFKGRQILLIGDILREDFYTKIGEFLKYQEAILNMYSQEWGYQIPTEAINKKKEEWASAVNLMNRLNICDVSELLRQKLADGKMILAEGAQGAMLDNDFGDYPFVTSSNTLPANVCLGLGIPPQSIGEIYGVIKAYTTKVGGGAFPSRMKDEKVESAFQEAGHEYGATTGRKRMCGWNDLPALKRAIWLSGVTKICINKADICPVETIEIVTDYIDVDGNLIQKFPLHLKDVKDTETVKFPGWGDKACGVTRGSDLPRELLAYIKYLEEELKPLGVEIAMIGTGAERNETVHW